MIKLRLPMRSLRLCARYSFLAYGRGCVVAGAACVLHSTLCLDGTIAGLPGSEKGSIG